MYILVLFGGIYFFWELYDNEVHEEEEFLFSSLRRGVEQPWRLAESSHQSHAPAREGPFRLCKVASAPTTRKLAQ